MTVIINADDLGISEDVNVAILDLIRQGRVTSATLIANGPAVESVLARVRSVQSCSFGVHLNASEFHPLSRNPDLGPLLDKSGCFSGNVRAIGMTRALKVAIFHEWSAQIERLIAFGLRPSHIDSHHHVHTIPALFTVLKRLQYRYKIRKVRISKNIYGASHPVSAQLLFQKKVWNLALRNIYRTRATAAFTSLLEYCELLKNGRIDRWVNNKRIERPTVELMVHPGNNSQTSHDEMAILRSGWPEAVGISKISYASL